MRTISHFLTDKTFLKKVFAYLEMHHEVLTVIVDKEGRIDPLEGWESREHPEKKFFPIAFDEDIGGVRCSAETQALLEAAEPHIQLSLDALHRLLEKALVMQQSMDEMLRLSDQLHFLFGLANKLAGVQDPEKYCRLVLQEIGRAINADAAFVYTRGKKSQQWKIPYRLPIQDIDALDKDPVLLSGSDGKTVIVTLQNGMSAVVTPIQEKEEQIGRMVFLRKPDRSVFSAYDKKFVSIINSIISPTMETLVLYHSLHVLYLNTVKALAAAIDAKDAYTHGHSFRVAKYSVAIGRKLKISDEELPDLEIAAYMHDLGKIGVSESVLAKPGKLSAAEFEEIKKHPLLTNKILEPIHLPDFIVNATLQHHERLDGRGYPFGLKGDEISLFAKIIAVADVFDALTSARPYRDAMTVENALTIICHGKDTEFDRKVVHAFFSALRDNVTDHDLAGVYADLKFMRLEQMNQFLEKLTQRLIGDQAELNTKSLTSSRQHECPESRSSSL
ncbi:MAG: HD-GYP domain-containing protein [Acidobacteria bacterium]|nr:HD-GYP domain-containing protein [Acidobacteriota bacterium]